jgi:N-formylglutamate amidohydrolase
MNNLSNLPKNDIFNFYPPEDKFIGILSIPHSGEIIPEEFEQYLSKDNKTRMQDVDFRVNELVDIQQLQAKGIAVLVANIHRVCVDLNRSSELCVLNWKKNSMGKELVIQEPTEDEVSLLRQKYYAPYYTMMKSMIEELHRYQDPVSFIDLHSMPSRPTAYHLAINPNQAKERPDFCVSDIEGKSCTPEFINHTCDQLKSFSPNVTKNDPYFGGHVTRHVDAEFAYTNNIQIEIKRGIYMDEENQQLDRELVANLRPNLTSALINVFEHFAN